MCHINPLQTHIQLCAASKSFFHSAHSLTPSDKLSRVKDALHITITVCIHIVPHTHCFSKAQDAYYFENEIANLEKYFDFFLHLPSCGVSMDSEKEILHHRKMSI